MKIFNLINKFIAHVIVQIVIVITEELKTMKIKNYLTHPGLTKIHKNRYFKNS